MIIPIFYAIVDADVLAARGVELRTFAEELRAAGVRLVQWRCKSGSPQEVLAGASVLREMFEEPTSQSRDPSAGLGQVVGHPSSLLIMNDRADLAVLAGFDGVHVGQGDLCPEDARAVVLRTITHPSQNREGWGTQVSGTPPTPVTRPHEWGTPRDEWGTRVEGGVVGVSTHTGEQVRAAELSCADYVAIGPVFATGTKSDADAVVGLEGVRRARGLTTKPLVGIGGITRANARSVVDAGADSVAVISGLFGVGESVEKVARDFLEILGDANHRGH